MKTLIAFLLLWIGAETDYNVKVPHPAIIQMTQTEMNDMLLIMRNQTNGN